MSQLNENVALKEALNVSENSFEIGLFCVYDTVLKKFDLPFCVEVSKISDYMSLLVNEVSSKYYGHESDYILNRIGTFNSDDASIRLNKCIERVKFLDFYVDKNKRKLQTIIQVLNYLPSGYFKMPVEQKEVIQEKIDNAITEYVASYVIPDLDVSQFDTNKVRDIYKRYDDLVKVV